MPLKALPVVVAAFDFDGTLTRRDTLMPFLARGLGWPRFLWVLLRSSPWLLAYALRLLPNDVAKQKLFLRAFKGRALAEMQAWTDLWLAQDLPGQLQAWTMERLAWHQKQGHCCVMVSASPDIYLLAVAEKLGFDGLICTEMAVDAGHLTGLMSTPNCYGEQKVVRLKSWLADRFGAEAEAGDLTLHAYGDTAGDWPLLRMAGQAWYRGRPWRSVAPSPRQ
ncbi:MAG: HAD-IB family hydrolase [Pseudomonadota bacterium]